MKKYAKMIGCIVLAGVFLGAMQFFCFGRGRDILQGGKEQGLVQAVNSFVRERKERIGAGGKQCVVVIDAGHGGAWYRPKESIFSEEISIDEVE